MQWGNDSTADRKINISKIFPLSDARDNTRAFIYSSVLGKNRGGENKQDLRYPSASRCVSRCGGSGGFLDDYGSADFKALTSHFSILRLLVFEVDPRLSRFAFVLIVGRGQAGMRVMIRFNRLPRRCREPRLASQRTPMKPSVGIAVFCLPWQKEWKIGRKKKIKKRKERGKREREREKESGETLMLAREGGGEDRVGRKWDCLSNSSRARAKDEGRSELGAFRLSALDKSASQPRKLSRKLILRN